MEYRLAALPAAWLQSTAVIVEDQTGHHYLLDLASGDMEELAEQDSVLLMQWHEPVITDAWHPLAELDSLAALH